MKDQCAARRTKRPRRRLFQFLEKWFILKINCFQYAKRNEEWPEQNDDTRRERRRRGRRRWARTGKRKVFVLFFGGDEKYAPKGDHDLSLPEFFNSFIVKSFRWHEPSEVVVVSELSSQEKEQNLKEEAFLFHDASSLNNCECPTNAAPVPGNDGEVLQFDPIGGGKSSRMRDRTR